jgi:hypothetical protein
MPQKQPNNLLKYSNLAIQMGLIIWIAVWAGQKLDSKFQYETPVFTITLSLVGIMAALYLVLKDLIKPRK